jgi:hypothetical protein
MRERQKMSTDFSKKCEILSEVHSESLWNEDLRDFKEYNDIGLPLAYLVNKEIATASDKGIEYIEETWKELCLSLEINPDKEYKDSDELLEEAGIDLLDDDEEE